LNPTSTTSTVDVGSFSLQLHHHHHYVAAPPRSPPWSSSPAPAQPKLPEFKVPLVVPYRNASLDTPPDALKLTDFIPRQYAAKRAMVKSQVETSNSAPEWIQQLMGMMLVGNIASSNRAISINTPMTPGPPQYHPAPSTPFTPVPTLKRPGSPLAYPTLDIWLESLENDPVRQRKARGYQDFWPFFSTNGIEDLEDLLHLTSDELMKIIPDINIGTAKWILAFAQDDDPALRERKRPHLV